MSTKQAKRNSTLLPYFFIPILFCAHAQANYLSKSYTRLDLDISRYESNPSLYYANIQIDENLKTNLYKILNFTHKSTIASDELLEITDNQICDTQCYSHNVLGYKEARKVLFGEINSVITRSDNQVFDYYCSVNYVDGQIVNGVDFKFQSGQIPSATVINTEHLWPKSKFGVNEETNYALYEMMVSDLHHLLPTDTIVNRDRYNFDFGEVDIPNKELPCSESIVGSSNSASGTFFEPPEQIKGDIARSIFYFSTKYNLPIDSDQEIFLRKWNEADKVSQIEIDRNNIIHKVEGVRNPFIDYPEFVKEIKDF